MNRRDFIKISAVAAVGAATYTLPLAKPVPTKLLNYAPVTKYDIVEIVIDSSNVLRLPIKKALNHPAFYKNQHKIINGRVIL